MLHPLFVQGEGEVVVIDQPEAVCRAHHHRDHVVAEEIAAIVLAALAPFRALLAHFAQADGHLGGAQIDDGHGM